MSGLAGLGAEADPISTVELAEWLMTTFGSVHRSGFVQVQKTVREIALATGRSPGTIQSHLRRMDALGIRLDPRNRLFDQRRLNDLAGSGGPVEELPPAVTESPQMTTDDAGVAGHVRALAALVELVGAVPDELPAALEIASRVLADAARADDELRGGCANGARAPREIPRDSLISSTDELISTLVNGGTDEETARKPDSSRGVMRDRAELHDLVAPLVELCERLSLPGISDSAGLSRRLAPYTDAQVRFALRKLIVEAKSGACSRPMGKLANISGEQVEDYFPADPPEVHLAGDPPAAVAIVATDLEGPEPATRTESRVDASEFLKEARSHLKR